MPLCPAATGSLLSGDVGSLDGQQEWHHLRLTGLRGRGGMWDMFRVHLDSQLSSICESAEPDSAESPAGSSGASMLVSLLHLPTSDLFELLELFEEIFHFSSLNHSVEGASLNISNLHILFWAVC